MSGTFVQFWRFGLVCLCVLTAFGWIFHRLYELHVDLAPEYAAQAENHRRTLVRLEPRRGDIRDSRGELLAGTRPVVDLGIDPHVFSDEALPRLEDLARLLELDAGELARIATTRTRGVQGSPAVRPVRWVKLAEVDDATYEAAMALRIRGVYGNRRFLRHYPAGSLAAHITGFLNREETAVLGVEQHFDFFLRGQPGWKVSENDGRRREIAAFRNREAPPSNGYNVVLTIDSVIQSFVEDEIENLVGQYSPEGVSIIVSDPRDGSILAMANHPTFDPNRFWDFPIGNQRNRAVTDVYEPGSVFKIVPVAAALEERLVNRGTLIDCSLPVVEYAGRSVRLPSDVRPLGELPLSGVVARSSNRGSAIVGMMLGSQRLHAWCERFGFGTPTGWVLGGEVSGRLHPVRAWDGLTISRLPAGYAVSVTPLQMHKGMSVIAGGGYLRAPFVVREVLDRSGEKVMMYRPREGQRVLSAETSAEMAELLVGAVGPEGTARRARISGFEVAGKTGTSRKILNGRYSERHHIASFSGFFPAGDPRVVVTVVVDDAKTPGTSYGGVVAAPAFQRIGERIARYLNLEPVSAPPVASNP